jgi:hypothetical protein
MCIFVKQAKQYSTAHKAIELFTCLHQINIHKTEICP